MKWPWQTWFKKKAPEPPKAPSAVPVPTHAVVHVPDDAPVKASPVALLYLHVDFESILFRNFFEEQNIRVIAVPDEASLREHVREFAGSLVVTDQAETAHAVRSLPGTHSIIYVADQDEETVSENWKDSDFVVTRPVDGNNPMGFRPELVMS